MGRVYSVRTKVAIPGSASGAHFGHIKAGRIVALEYFNGQAPVYGKPKLTPGGQFRRAYMVKHADTGLVVAYIGQEIQEWDWPAEFETHQTEQQEQEGESRHG